MDQWIDEWLTISLAGSSHRYLNQLLQSKLIFCWAMKHELQTVCSKPSFHPIDTPKDIDGGAVRHIE